MSKKRGRKNRSKREPSQEPHQRQAPAVDHTRRKLLGMIGLGGAAVAGGVFGVRALLKDELSEEKPTPDNPPAPTDKPSVIQDPELESLMLRMPSVKFTDEKVTYPKPAKIKLSDEEFRKAAIEYAQVIERLFITKLNNSFNRLDVSKLTMKDKGHIFSKFVLAAAEEALKNPHFAEYIKANKDTKYTMDWEQILKPLFAAGGLHLSMIRTSGGLDATGNHIPVLKLDIHRIVEDEVIEMNDKNGTSKIPLVTLGDRLFGLEDNTLTGEYDPELDFALIYKNNMNAAKRIDELIKLGAISERPKDMERVAKEYLRDVKIHEATHVLMGMHYKLARSREVYELYQVPLRIPINQAGLIGDASGPFNPVQFQEVCAVGSEIFHNESDFPLSFAALYGSNPNLGYKMIHQLLPILTLKLMPESPEKNLIISRRKSGSGTLKATDFARLALTKFSKEDRKKLGALLYAYGERFLKQATSGGLQRVGGTQ